MAIGRNRTLDKLRELVKASAIVNKTSISVCTLSDSCCPNASGRERERWCESCARLKLVPGTATTYCNGLTNLQSSTIPTTGGVEVMRALWLVSWSGLLYTGSRLHASRASCWCETADFSFVNRFGEEGDSVLSETCQISPFYRRSL